MLHIVVDKVVHDLSIPVYTHTCGAIGDRLDLLVECGVSGIECLDPPPLGNVDLSEAELAERRKSWQPRSHDFQSGALWRYAQTVGSACDGAVTHPGAKAETHCFADI